MKNYLIGCIALLSLPFLLPSCANTRQITYMQGSFDTAKLSQIKIPEARVRPGDLLSIIVYSDNPEATALFNQSLIIVSNSSAGGAGGAPTGTGGAGGGTGSNAGAIGGSPTTPGYLVDEEGNIQFQGLGLLHVEGLTKDSIKILLDSRLMQYLKNPYYTIRFMNYRFTMLGEVTRPGIFSIPGEHVSLLDAIGLAGDLTLYGRRDNILVLRETEGKRQWGRLDMTKPDVMLSPFYYLQQNDVVYVEATKRKIQANDQVTTRNVTIVATIISTIALVYSLLKK